MQENIQKATECMEQDVSYLKDKLGCLTSKMGSFDSKKWYCCFGKYPANPAYQFNLPEETTWWILQAGSQKSVVQLCSWAPITAAVSAGQPEAAPPPQNRGSGTRQEQQNLGWVRLLPLGDDPITERHSRIHSVLRAVPISPLVLVYWLQVVIEITPQIYSLEFDSLVVQTWLRL